MPATRRSSPLVALMSAIALVGCKDSVRPELHVPALGRYSISFEPTVDGVAPTPDGYVHITYADPESITTVFDLPGAPLVSRRGTYGDGAYEVRGVPAPHSEGGYYVWLQRLHGATNLRCEAQLWIRNPYRSGACTAIYVDEAPLPRYPMVAGTFSISGAVEAPGAGAPYYQATGTVTLVQTDRQTATVTGSASAAIETIGTSVSGLSQGAVAEDGTITFYLGPVTATSYWKLIAHRTSQGLDGTQEYLSNGTTYTGAFYGRAP